MSIYTYEEFKTALEEGATCAKDDRLLRTFCSKDFLLYFKQHNKELEGPKLYRYMMTFTLPDDHTFDEDTVERYIIKQCKRAPLRIVEAHYAKEHTQKGVAHWHVLVAAEIPCKKNRFDYYEEKYGIILYSKTRAKTLKHGIDYINKETVSIKII